MGTLRFKNAEKQIISFGDSFVEFIRNQINTKIAYITYSNATGQSLVANQILFTYLTPGLDGYIEIKSVSNQTLNGSGIFNVSIVHQSSINQVHQNISFDLFSSTVNFDFNYNSKPEVGSILIGIQNRATHVFTVSEFKDQYSDFDNDDLIQISISGIVDGYKINGNDYISGDWILLSTIDSGLFTYDSKNQDSYYEIDNNWFGKDFNENISNAGNIKISVDELEPAVCTPPILESAIRQLDTLLFDLVWNYDGIDYSVQDPTTVIRIYISNNNINYESYPLLYPYTTTSTTVDLTSKAWEVFYFKIRLVNEDCDLYSNVINVNI